MARRKATKVDTLLERIFSQRCHGQIGVMDISAVFTAGQRAAYRCAADAAASGTVPFDLASCEEIIAAAMVARFNELRVEEGSDAR